MTTQDENLIAEARGVIEAGAFTIPAGEIDLLTRLADRLAVLTEARQVDEADRPAVLRQTHKVIIKALGDPYDLLARDLNAWAAGLALEIVNGTLSERHDPNRVYLRYPDGTPKSNDQMRAEAAEIIAPHEPEKEFDEAFQARDWDTVKRLIEGEDYPDAEALAALRRDSEPVELSGNTGQLPSESDVRERIARVLCEASDSVWDDLLEDEVDWHYRDADAILAAFPILSRDIAGDGEAEREDTEDGLYVDAYVNGLRRAAEIVRDGR